MEPARRREQILKHAARLFGEQGYHATSIENIIRSARIARGTFYLYFRNKRAIFEELIDRLVVQIKRCIKTVDTTAHAPSAHEQLLGNLVRIIELLDENRALLSILLEGAVGLDKGFGEKLSGFYAQIADTIELSLILGQKMELVRPCQTRIAALVAVGALKEVLHERLRSGLEKSDTKTIASEILDIFSRGVLLDGVTIA